MKMAVTEACTNVVVHAYESDSGVLEVEMRATEEVTIVVRDMQRDPAAAGALRAAGTWPRPAADRRPLGRVRAAWQRRQRPKVRMTFSYTRESDPAESNPVAGTVRESTGAGSRRPFRRRRPSG